MVGKVFVSRAFWIVDVMFWDVLDCCYHVWGGFYLLGFSGTSFAVK